MVRDVFPLFGAGSERLQTPPEVIISNVLGDFEVNPGASFAHARTRPPTPRPLKSIRVQRVQNVHNSNFHIVGFVK